MKILVTGSAGFIGSHLCDRLLELGHKVIGIDDLSSGKNLNPKVKLYKINTADRRVSGIFKTERPSLVFHLAANTNVPLSVMDPLFDFQTLVGTLNIIQQEVPIIYLSSSFVYGNAKRPTKEKEPFQLTAPYGITKHTSENYFEFFKKTYGFYSIIVRPATVYGPRQTGGAMADYFRKLSKGEQAIIYGDKTRDYLYITDLIDALILLMDRPVDYSLDNIYNVGTGKETSLETLYSKIAKLLDKEDDPQFEFSRIGEVDYQSLNCAKLKRLGWKVKVNLDEGLLCLKEYLKEQKKIPSD